MLHDSRLVLSNIEVVAGRMPEAEEWLEQVLDEYPGDTGTLNDLGYLWTDQGKHLERALRMIQEAVAAEPKNPAYRDSLGWAFYRLHRYGEAVVELQIATAVEKPDGIVLDHLGDAFFAQGDGAAALAAWTKAAATFDKEDEKQKSKQTQGKIDRRGPSPPRRSSSLALVDASTRHAPLVPQANAGYTRGIPFAASHEPSPRKCSRGQPSRQPLWQVIPTGRISPTKRP